MPRSENIEHHAGFGDFPNPYTRHDKFEHGTVVYVSRGIVGEIVETDRSGERILHVAGSGALVGGQSMNGDYLGDAIVLSTDALIQIPSREALETPHGIQLLSDGVRRRAQQTRELLIQGNMRDKRPLIGYGLGELDKLSLPEPITVTGTYIGLWLGLSRETVSVGISRLRERGIVKGPNHSNLPHIRILDRDLLAKEREYSRPIRRGR